MDGVGCRDGDCRDGNNGNNDISNWRLASSQVVMSTWTRSGESKVVLRREPLVLIQSEDSVGVEVFVYSVNLREKITQYRAPTLETEEEDLVSHVVIPTLAAFDETVHVPFGIANYVKEFRSSVKLEEGSYSFSVPVSWRRRGSALCAT